MCSSAALVAGERQTAFSASMPSRPTRYGSHFNALFCRRELPMLDDAIERSKDIYGPLKAQFNEQKKEWRFPAAGD
jgi:hypothetical protein